VLRLAGPGGLPPNGRQESLLNVPTTPEGGEGVLARNKLFATLDPTTRRLELPSARRHQPNGLLLTDTVGFQIRELPPTAGLEGLPLPPLEEKPWRPMAC